MSVKYKWFGGIKEVGWLMEGSGEGSECMEGSGEGSECMEESGGAHEWREMQNKMQKEACTTCACQTSNGYILDTQRLYTHLLVHHLKGYRHRRCRVLESGVNLFDRRIFGRAEEGRCGVR
jgi:hypothetical protein